MKKILALTVVLTAFIGLTQIAYPGPERYEAKSMVQPTAMEEACNWTGFHLGVHAGWAEGPLNWIDSDQDVGGQSGKTPQTPEVLDNQTTSGVLGGFQGGYDYQWRWLVIGAEGEFSYADMKSDNIKNGFVDHFYSRNDFGGSIAGRLGFAWNKWLFYGKGGGAFAHTKYNLDHNKDIFTADETRFSPMVGAGIEYMINCHWSMKLEYQHAFFGTEAIDGTNVEEDLGYSGKGPSREHETYDIDTQQNSVRAGLNFRF